MAISLQQFIDNIQESGLMSAADISAFRESLPADQRPHDAQGLARELIAHERLTRWQAKALYKGRTRGLIFGEYEVMDRIGVGGMGQVFKARHRTMDRIVALKVLSAKAVNSQDAIQRFHREARAAAKLAHPNIVTAHDASEHDGIHYLVMEYAEGLDLAAFVKKHGPLPADLAVACILQAATGLEYAHRRGVVHRDIKPANLLLTKNADSPVASNGTGADWTDRDSSDDSSLSTALVKILDMGLARVDSTLDAAEDTDHLTGTGQVMGTCDYMAPEQATDTHTADQRSDIYSLGCTMFRLLTGARPFRGDSLMQILMAHQKAPIPSLRDIRPELPCELDAVFQKMVAKDPGDRYQTMGEVITALQTYLDGGSSSADGAPQKSTNQALQDFLKDLPSGSAPSGNSLSGSTSSGSTSSGSTPSASNSNAGYEETIDGQMEQVTADDRSSKSIRFRQRKPRKTTKRRTLLLGIGGGVAVIILLAVTGFILLGGGADAPDKAPETDEQQTQEVGDGLSPDGTPDAVPVMPPDASPNDPPDEPPVGTPSDGQSDSGYVVLPWPAEERANAKLEIDRKTQEIAQWIDPDDPDRLLLSLPSGVHTLWMVRRGHEPFERQIAIRSGQTLTVEPQWRLFDLGSPAAGYDSTDGPMQDEPDASPAEIDTPRTDSMDNLDTPLPDGSPTGPVTEAPPATAPKIDPELQRRQKEEAAYREALEPIEEMASRWEFDAAATALAKIKFDQPTLMDRRNARGRELQRIARLKRRMIVEINDPESQLSKSDLMLKGAGGTVVSADDNSIIAATEMDDAEVHAWRKLSDDARLHLVELVANKEQPGDCLDAVLLAFAVEDMQLADTYLDKAEKLGADVAPYLATRATAALDRARQLLADGGFSEADKALKALENKYGEIPWMETNRLLFDATRKAASSGLYEAEAEKLYVEAVGLFEQKELFDLRDVLNKLKANYPESRAVTGSTRQPAFAALEDAIRDLGEKLTVRQDGEGDYTTIQAAIDAAEPNSLIEIQDGGTYNESVAVPAQTSGLTIRGSKGTLPIVTSLGKHSDFPVLVDVASDDCTLERLALLHIKPSGDFRRGVYLKGTNSHMKNCLVYCSSGIALSCEGGKKTLESCIWLGDIANSARPYFVLNCIAHDCKFGGNYEADIRNSTFGASLAFGVSSVISSCVAVELERANQGLHRVERCVVGKVLDLDSIQLEGSVVTTPRFVAPRDLDYRLAPGSPGTGMATDGGDIGCRYTPEMMKMCEIALELRGRGIIKF